VLKKREDHALLRIDVARTAALLLDVHSANAMRERRRLFLEKGIPRRHDLAARAVRVRHPRQSHTVAVLCEQTVHTVELELLQKILLVFLRIAAVGDELW